MAKVVVACVAADKAIGLRTAKALAAAGCQPELQIAEGGTRRALSPETPVLLLWSRHAAHASGLHRWVSAVRATGRLAVAATDSLHVPPALRTDMLVRLSQKPTGPSWRAFMYEVNGGNVRKAIAPKPSIRPLLFLALLLVASVGALVYLLKSTGRA
jgi:hypothetical protein